MTYVFEKTFGKFDSSTNFEGNKLIVEYCFSSVSDSDYNILENINIKHYGDFYKLLQTIYLDNESNTKNFFNLLTNSILVFYKKYNIIFITLLLLTSTFAHRDGIIYYSRQALILCNAVI